jgi:hypothetical protein
VSDDSSTPPPGGSLDASVGIDSSLPGVDGSGPQPGVDSSPGDQDSSVPPDAGTDAPSTGYAGGANDSTDPVSLTPIHPSQYVYGAASTDGSAMLVIADSTYYSLSYSHYDVSTGWTNIAAIPGSPQSYQMIWPDVGVDSQGDVFVAWNVEAIGAPTTLNVVRYDHATNAWGATVQPDPYLGSQLGSALSVSPSGEALVLTAHGAMTDGGTSNRDVYALHYAAGTWTPELVQTEGLTANSLVTQVSLSDSGFAAASFTATFAANVFTRSTGGTWTAGPVFNNVGTSYPYEDALAANANGDVVYTLVNDGAYPQAYVRDGATQGWTGPTTIDSSSLTKGCIFPPLSMVLSSTGDAVVTRCDARGMVTVAYTKQTKTWSAPATVPTADGGSFQAGEINYDAVGNAFAEFDYSPDGGVQTAYSSSYSPAAGWAAPSGPIGTNQAYAIPPVQSPNGRRWVVWVEVGDPTIHVKKQP